MPSQLRSLFYVLEGVMEQTHTFAEESIAIEQAYDHFCDWLLKNSTGLVYESLVHTRTKETLWFVNFYVGGVDVFEARKIEVEELPEVLRVQLLVGAI